ncbi:MAG: amino acid permease [Neisseriaceae bacterium]|nr:MAG: amino acid permease [Neisseriaceae bacterium]
MNTNNNRNQLTHTIKTKHLVMLSLGGAIGTGLFLGSGTVINESGSLGAILAYIFGGCVTYFVMMCLGELSAYMPNTNAFGVYATKFIGPATGYVIAWTYWLSWALTLGIDFTAAAILMHEWFAHFPIWGWVLIFTALIFTFNIYSTKVFAESEFYLSLIKVITVIGFILLGLIVLFNILPMVPVKEYPNTYLNNFSGDNLFPHGWAGIFTTMLLVNFSFTGTELIAVAAGESEEPQKSVPKAIKATFWRLLIMFIGTITIIAFLFPRSQLGIDTDSISSSPFVLLLSQMNIPYVEDIIRFVIITALLSSANAGLYGSSRMLWSISNEYHLPKWINYLTKGGVPVYAVIITVLGALPGLLLKYFEISTVLNAIIDVSGITMVVVWMSICICQFNFRRKLLKEQKLISELPYLSPWYPFPAIIGFIFLFITAVSILLESDRIWSFIFCILFIVSCYIAYYWKEAPSSR